MFGDVDLRKLAEMTSPDRAFLTVCLSGPRAVRELDRTFRNLRRALSGGDAGPDTGTPRPDAAACDDGMVCNGAEWCHAQLDCQAGSNANTRVCEYGDSLVVFQGARAPGLFKPA